MLQELTITDFAIIQQVRIRFSDGLVIFTGETGAGKSIVLDAIGALLGDRMSADVVRAGTARAMVEGVFVLPWLPGIMATLPPPRHADEDDDDTAANHPRIPAEDSRVDPQHALAQVLAEFGLYDGEETIIISREILSTGRTTARINGRVMPVSMLARIGGMLVDVHGQGAHLALLRSEHHVDYIDRYADLVGQRRALAEGFRQWQANRRALQNLRAGEQELERRTELLRYQVDEITKANLRPGEIEEMERERSVLANAEQIRETSEVAYLSLTGNGEVDGQGVLDLLATTERALGDLVRMDGSLEETRATLEECRYKLEDVAATIRSYRDAAEADPDRLGTIEERLDRITRLRRKYGATIEEILAFAAESTHELEGIEHRDERIAELEALIATQRQDLGERAALLSQARQEAAARMAQAMESTLNRLNMRNARFVVQIDQHESPDGVPLADGRTVDLTATGIDRVEFLIAPNPGEPPKSLARIASGGETARLMLALKSILVTADATPTLIFDEVDAGISGLTGQIVGEMLWQLARQHQVLCVTHLPQMAAFGDLHLNVAKRIEEGRTRTVVTELDRAHRTLELAQMLGGTATEAAARNAAELLDRAQHWKEGQLPQANGSAKARPTSLQGRTNSERK